MYNFFSFINSKLTALVLEASADFLRGDDRLPDLRIRGKRDGICKRAHTSRNNFSTNKLLRSGAANS
jgi:hypothetical protein